MVASKRFSSGAHVDLVGYVELVHMLLCTLTPSILCMLAWQQQQQQHLCLRQFAGRNHLTLQPCPTNTRKQSLEAQIEQRADIASSLHWEPKAPCAVTQRRGGGDRRSLLIPEPRATT